MRQSLSSVREELKVFLAVPISFVSEHIETLEEIDVEYKELALKSGIEKWGRVPAALGCLPTFISDLADAVIKSLPYVGAMAVSNHEARQVFSTHHLCSYKRCKGKRIQFARRWIMLQDITTLLLNHKAFKDTMDIFGDRYKDMGISIVAGININLLYGRDVGPQLPIPRS